MVHSPFPVTVDGTSLDTVAWNIDVKARQWAGARAADVVLPGVDGVAASLNDDIDATMFTLSMWVLGTDTTGAVPAGTAMAQCRANMDTLSHLFGKRYALLDVRETVDNSAGQRQALCKVIDAVAPEIKAGGIGRFTVSLSITDGMWQDIALADWTQASAVSGTTYEVTTLQGSTAPIADAIFTVTGPATNPQLADIATGAYVRLNATIGSGVVWRVNSGTWATRYGSGLTFTSTDTTGTDGQAVTVYGGGTSRFLRLQPFVSSGLRRVQLALTGTGFTGATAIGVRARRKFLQ